MYLFSLNDAELNPGQVVDYQVECPLQQDTITLELVIYSRL